MKLIGKDVRIGACLFAGDMDRMVRFYRDTLGFHTRWDGGNFAEFETASGTLSFFMYGRKQFAKAIGEIYAPPNGINHTFEIALWLPSFADVDALYERLSNLDVRFPTGGPTTFSFGIRNIYGRSVLKRAEGEPEIANVPLRFRRSLKPSFNRNRYMSPTRRVICLKSAARTKRGFRACGQ